MATIVYEIQVRRTLGWYSLSDNQPYQFRSRDHAERVLKALNLQSEVKTRIKEVVKCTWKGNQPFLLEDK